MSRGPSASAAILALLASAVIFFSYRLYQTRRFYKGLASKRISEVCWDTDDYLSHNHRIASYGAI